MNSIWLRSLADRILGKVPGKPDRLDTATRMAMDAEFSDRSEPTTPACEPRRKGEGEPVPDVDPLDELLRIVGEAQERDAEDERLLWPPRRGQPPR